MNEPKTLKDIGNDPRFCSKIPMFARQELKNKLKQEAIKHYKKYFDQAFYQDKKGDESTKQFCLGHCAMIKEFLNLTEEDLK